MADLSYQLYSSRNFPPLDETLRLLSEIGYTSVETYGGLLEDQDALEAALTGTDLKVESSHIGLDVLEGEPNRVIETAQRFGMKSLFCPFLMPDMRPSDADGWRAFGAKLQSIADAFASHGLSVGWHNHDFEFVALPGGEIPMELILEGGPTIPWEADIAWIVRGGGDPLAYIEKYRDRITAVHIKDIAPAGECTDEDGWADVGEGVMDWGAILRALQALNVKHYVMEHDNPNDHERFARRSFSNVASLLER